MGDVRGIADKAYEKIAELMIKQGCEAYKTSPFPPDDLERQKAFVVGYAAGALAVMSGGPDMPEVPLHG